MELKLAVLDDDDGRIAQLKCWERLSNGFEVQFFSKPMSPDALSEFEVIVTVRERTIFTRDFVNKAKRLRHLALTGRFSNQADLNALKERGVAVSYTDGSGGAAAELTIALILGLTKGVVGRHNAVQAGEWRSPRSELGLSLSGKTLGVLGLGRVGSRVAMFGKLMDMNVVSWGPTDNRDAEGKYGVMRLTLDNCLQQADVLAICLRLSEKTKGLLGARELGLLKDGARVVNTARAEIIDRQALYAELGSRRISGAFDVFHEEPLPVDDPIRSFPNVLLSPHVGYVTEDVYQVFFSQVVENVLAWTTGREFRNALYCDSMPK